MGAANWEDTREIIILAQDFSLAFPDTCPSSAVPKQSDLLANW